VQAELLERPEIVPLCRCLQRGTPSSHERARKTFQEKCAPTTLSFVLLCLKTLQASPALSPFRQTLCGIGAVRGKALRQAQDDAVPALGEELTFLPSRTCTAYNQGVSERTLCIGKGGWARMDMNIYRRKLTRAAPGLTTLLSLASHHTPLIVRSSFLKPGIFSPTKLTSRAAEYERLSISRIAQHPLWSTESNSSRVSREGAVSRRSPVYPPHPHNTPLLYALFQFPRGERP